jgi:hypothetical protein
LATPPIEDQKIYRSERVDGVNRDGEEKVEPHKAVGEWYPAGVGFEVVKILAFFSNVRLIRSCYAHDVFPFLLSSYGGELFPITATATHLLDLSIPFSPLSNVN